ncbi:hypothetical protein [Spirosoma oryzicola]|uniref:hypothetical protein n=1 Tax=Spirosoma oryzicola TaxID=2898794 RepID=UPI001E44C0DE|nr:hypothetical protein [Spirosoma oryzicola]UHG94350.1 hypothetical protein LQ777_27590 [Spirosoma oryzicola]
MRTYSLSVVLLVAVLLGTSLSSFRFDYTLPGLKEVKATNKRVLANSSITKHVFGGSLSGSYPSGQGFHSYGAYPLDLSNIANGSNFTISFNAGDTPNRFYVQDGVGNSWYGHHNSAYNTNPAGSPPPPSDPYNNWIGYTSSPGPWGFSGISGATSGSFSVTKVSGRTYTLYVETVTNSSTDYWSLTY